MFSNRHIRRHRRTLNVHIQSILASLRLIRSTSNVFSHHSQAIIRVQQNGRRIARDQHLRAVTILFILHSKVASIIAVHRPHTTVVRVVVLSARMFRKLSARIRPHVTDDTFVLLGRFMTYSLLNDRDHLIARRVLIRTTQHRRHLFGLNSDVNSHELIRAFQVRFRRAFTRLLIFHRLNQGLIGQITTRFGQIREEPNDLFLRINDASIPGLRSVRDQIVRDQDVRTTRLSICPLKVLFTIRANDDRPITNDAQSHIVTKGANIVVGVRPRHCLNQVNQSKDRRQLRELVNGFFNSNEYQVILLASVLHPKGRSHLFITVRIYPPVRQRIQVLNKERKA